MSYPKLAKHYPPEFFQILIRLEKEPAQQFRLECASLREAQAQRAQLYAFRNAVEADPELLKMYPETPSMMLVLDGNVVVVLHRDFSPAAERIRKALAKSDKEEK